MLTVGITQLGGMMRGRGRMEKGAIISASILVGTQAVYLIVSVDCGVVPVLVGDTHAMVLAQ